MDNWGTALEIRNTNHIIEDIRGESASKVFTDGNCPDLVLMDQQILGDDAVKPFGGDVWMMYYVDGLVAGPHYFSQINGRFADINGQYDVTLYKNFLPELLGTSDQQRSSYYTTVPQPLIESVASAYSYGGADRMANSRMKMMQSSLILDAHAATEFDKSFDIEKALYELGRHPFFDSYEEKHGDVCWVHKRDIAKEALGLA